MSDYTDWLGPAADDLTDDQRETFDRAADAYYRLPFHEQRDPEDITANAAEDDHVLTAILQAILREGSLETAAREARMAQAALDGWVRASAAMGMSERDIEQRSQLARMTVRKRLGK